MRFEGVVAQCCVAQYCVAQCCVAQCCVHSAVDTVPKIFVNGCIGDSTSFCVCGELWKVLGVKGVPVPVPIPITFRRAQWNGQLVRK